MRVEVVDNINLNFFLSRPNLKLDVKPLRKPKNNVKTFDVIEFLFLVLNFTSTLKFEVPHEMRFQTL